MKTTSGGFNATGLIGAIVVFVLAWVVIVWVTRRLKRDMSAKDG